VVFISSNNRQFSGPGRKFSAANDDFLCHMGGL
jgi:hypothetical protein